MAIKKGFYLICVLVIFFSGCRSNKVSSCRILLDWFPNANHLPLIVGERLGIFKKYGLEIEVIALQDPPSTLSYFKTNQADVALYYFPSAIKAYKAYPKFTIIGKLFDQPLYCLYARSHVTLSDLSMKKLGTYGDIFSNAVFQSLQKNHKGFANIVHSLCDLPHLFYFDQIDVASGSINVEALQLEDKLGPLSIFSWQDLGIPKHPEIVCIAQDEYLKSRPGFALAFQRALQEAIDVCKSNKTKAKECYFEAFPEKKSSRAWESRSCDKTIDFFTHNQEFNEKEIEEFLVWFQSHSPHICRQKTYHIWHPPRQREEARKSDTLTQKFTQPINASSHRPPTTVGK